MSGANPTPSTSTPNMTNTQKKQKLDKDPAIPVQMQRRRVWRACEGCRRKKIKCDGRTPVCSQCSLTSATCTWLETKDRAALSRHYVQELEARVLQMESLLQEFAPAMQRVSEATSAQATQGSKPPTVAPLSARPSENRGTGSAPTTPDMNQRDDPLDETVTDQFGQLALDSHGHLRWIGSSSSIALIEAFRNMSDAPSAYNPIYPPEQDRAVNRLFFAPSLGFGTRVKALPGPEEVEYPPRDLADKLVTAYFASFHHTLPVLDSPTFIERYQQHMDEAVHHTPTPACAGFISLIFAIFACGSRFIDDERLNIDAKGAKSDEGMGMVYYERAMILYYIGSSATQLAHVQTFVLLSSYLASANHLPQSWLLCGQAVRIAQDLGLHRSPRHLLLTPIDKETRRKVWWCVYGLDRMLAVSLGRPIAVEDADCDAELPLELDDVDLPQYFARRRSSVSVPSTPGSTTSASPATPPPTNNPPLMKGFIALTMLYKIAGKVLRSVYALDKCKDNLEEHKMAELQAMVDQLDSELNSWCDNLPSVFKNDPKTPQQVTFGAILCTSYYAVLITLHRNFLPTRRGQTPASSSSSVTKSICASRSCIFFAQSMKDAIPPSHHLAFFVQYLFSSAVIILLCVMHTSDVAAAGTAMGEVEACMHCLAELESSWPGAKKCKEVLSELIQVTRAGMALRMSGQSPATSSPRGSEPGPSTSARPVRRLSRARQSLSGTRGDADLRGSHSPLGTTEETFPGSQRNSPISRSSSFKMPGPGGFPRSSPPSSSRAPQKKRAHDSIKSETGDAMEFAFHNTFSSTYSPPLQNQEQPSHNHSPSSSQHFAQPNPLDSTGSFNAYDHSQPLSPSMFSFVQPPSFYDNPPNWPFANVGDTGINTGANSSPTQTNTVRFNQVSPLMSYSTVPSGSQAAGQFDLTGLPFSGLDFLHNFTPAVTPGVDNGGVDPFWTTLGGGAFKFGPDLPFTLSDAQGEGGAGDR